MMGITPRTLELWEAQEPKKLGRPGHSEEEYRRALRPVRRAIEELGWRTGAEVVFGKLGMAIPLRVVRRVLRWWKAWHERRRRRRVARQRLTVEVARRDALWCVDATLLGRVAGEKIHGIALRDVGSSRSLALSTGGPPRGADVVALLEEARIRYGVLPRVLASDNGPENVNAELDGWLRAHHVIHLKSLPYTPQHNPWAERGMAELKGAAGIGKREVFASLEEAEERLLQGWLRVDRATPRKAHSWRSRELAYEEMESCYTPDGHEDFYRTACAAVEAAVQGASTAHERRRAERGAIYATLEGCGLIKRTRGGVPLGAVKGEGLS